MSGLVVVLTVVVVAAAVYMGWKLVEVLVLAAVTFLTLLIAAWLLKVVFGGFSKVAEGLAGDTIRLLNQFEKLQKDLTKAMKRARRVEEIDKIWQRISEFLFQLQEVDKKLGARSVQLGRAIEELENKQSQDKDDLVQFEALVAKAEQEGKQPAEIVPSYTPVLHKVAARQIQSNESILAAYGELAETLDALHDAVREAVGWIEAGYASWEKEREVLKDLNLQDRATRRILTTMPPLTQVKDPFAKMRLAQLRDTKETVGRLRKIVAALPPEEQEERSNPIHVAAQEIAQAL